MRKRPKPGDWLFDYGPGLCRQVERDLLIGWIKEIPEEQYLMPTFHFYISAYWDWLPSFGHDRHIRRWWFEWPFRVRIGFNK